MKKFETVREKLSDEFKSPAWIEDSGAKKEELFLGYGKLITELSLAPRAIIKARTFAYLLDTGRIAIDKEDIFQDKLEHFNILHTQREKWQDEVIEKYLSEEAEKQRISNRRVSGGYGGGSDFGHTSPNTRLMLKIGFIGILERVKRAAGRDGLTEKQKVFYESCIITWEAIIRFARRLSEATRPYNEENADALLAISERAPETTYEAMQLIILYFFLHEYVAGTRVRTLGRLDDVLYPFYKRDLERGTYSKEEISELLRYFFNKFWVANVPYDLPFAIGGIDRDGNEVTNELSYLIVDVYNGMDIHSPKIHVRVSEKTPHDFLKKVLSAIRGGNSSFVFTNDSIAIKSLISVGIDEEDARDYTPIGCYEPAVFGVEVGCTGNADGNLAKAVELVITNGKDLKSGAVIGAETGEVESYDDFLRAIKTQISYMTKTTLDYVSAIEKKYDLINPDPILSAQYDRCVELGIDAYEGGAKYNNSSFNASSIASLTDSVAAVKRLVFDLKLVTLSELFEILKNNWHGYENLRMTARRLPEKYGNGDPLADSIAGELSEHYASCVNNVKNGRGGVFKAGLFGIDFYIEYGKNTMATPDGRYAGEPLSKNIAPTPGMDKNGVTSLIRSVTAMNHSLFPNGSVLDVVLHPSAVSGDDGLEAFLGILLTYMKLGGFALHGNVFNVDELKRARANPEDYKNLQVRVCGWNSYFVNLSKEEQDQFIRQAENAV